MVVYPTLLCIPATLVSYEGLFCSGGYIVNKTLSSLEPSTVNMLLSVRSWLSDDNVERKNTYVFIWFRVLNWITVVES